MRYIDLDKVKETDKGKLVLFLIVAVVGIWVTLVIAMALMHSSGGAVAAVAQASVKDPGVAAANNTTRAYTPTITFVPYNASTSLRPRCVDGIPCTLNASGPQVNITPVPIVTKAPFDELKPGIRNQSQFFTIHRDNVSGYKSLTIKTTVYGWQELSQVKWYSDGYGKYFYQFAPRGEKYVFVYLVEYVDGTTLHEDPGMWYFGPQLFRLQVGDHLYDQDPEFMPEVRLKELEEVEGFNRIKGLRPFGYLITQRRGIGNITADIDPQIRMGINNAKDGYLVYRVPSDADPSEMTLVGNFGGFGSAGWELA